MGKVDPTGFDSVLAKIPKGQLSERQERIATGLAMIQNGSSIKRAAQTCGIPVSTLWNYHHGISTLGSETGFERDLKSVQAVSHDIALIAGENIVKSLTTEPEAWKPGDLVKAYGVATDKVIAFQAGGQASAPNGIAELVGSLLEQGDISIKRRDKAAEAVEVEAERVE